MLRVLPVLGAVLLATVLAPTPADARDDSAFCSRITPANAARCCRYITPYNADRCTVRPFHNHPPTASQNSRRTPSLAPAAADAFAAAEPGSPRSFATEPRSTRSARSAPVLNLNPA